MTPAQLSALVETETAVPAAQEGGLMDLLMFAGSSRG
jgi:hypothetical protein